MKIPASQVTIRRQYLVDCKVCAEGVETDEQLLTREEAEAARQRHLDEHERDEL
jgi:hypothetical protein